MYEEKKKILSDFHSLQRKKMRETKIIVFQPK